MTGDDHGTRSIEFSGEEGIPFGIGVVGLGSGEETLVVAEVVLQGILGRGHGVVAIGGHMGAAAMGTIVHLDSHSDMVHELRHSVALLVGGRPVGIIGHVSPIVVGGVKAS